MPAVTGDLVTRTEALLALRGDLVARLAARQGLSGELLHRAGGLQGLTGNLVQRLVARQGASGDLVHRASNRRVAGDLVTRCSTTRSLRGDLVQRASAPHPDYATAVTTGQTATGHPVSDFAIDLQAWRPGSSVYIDRAYDLTITLRESAAATWELSVWDEDGTYNPENPDSATWSGRMGDQPFGADGQFARRFLVDATYGGAEFHFTGLPTAYGYTQEWRGRQVAFTWRGVDGSHKLFRENQTMSDVRSTRRSVASAKGAIGSVLGAYGIPYDLSLLVDRAVPYQSRQKSKPIDWIAQLLEVGWEEWRMRGDTFIAYYPTPMPKEQAHWTIDLGTDMVADYSVEATLTPAASKVTCRRVVEAGGVLAEVDVTGPYGQYSASWGKPGYGIRLEVTYQAGGQLSDFVFFDAGGAAKAVMYPRTNYGTLIERGSANGCVECKYTWGVPAGGGGWAGGGARFRILGTRGQREDSLFGSAFDETFTHTETNTAYIDDPEAFPKELSDNPLIPTPGWMRTHCQRYLQKFGRRARTHTLKLHHPHLLLEPSQTVRLINPRVHADRALYVTEVKHHFSDDPEGRCTEFTALEYL